MCNFRVENVKIDVAKKYPILTQHHFCNLQAFQFWFFALIQEFYRQTGNILLVGFKKVDCGPMLAW